SKWIAHYQGRDCLCPSKSILSDVDGWFNDNSVDDYANNSNCSWLIRPHDFNGTYPDSITLTFYNFNTEEGNDVVTVYDGDSTDAPILATLSGSINSISVTSTDSSMLVVFTTNDSVNASGWEASYYSHANLDFYVYSDNEEMGTVTGSGSHPRDTEFTIEAIPNDGYVFSHWSDNNADNPRTLWSSDWWNGDGLWAYFLPVRETDIPDNVPEEGLIAYYPFEGNADDYSGNNNHGFPSWNSPDPTTDRFGNENSAYQFYGYCGQNGIRVSHSNSLALDTAFTASFWVLQQSGCNHYGDNKFGNIICRDGDWDGLCINLGDEYDNGQPDVQRLDFFNKNGDGENNFNLNSYMNCHGTPKWTHYVTIADGRHLSIYCNGVLVADTVNEQTASFSSANDRDLMIGIFGDNYLWPFNGKLDDIALYNRALSADEVLSLYGGFISCSQPLDLTLDTITGNSASIHWSFDHCDSTAFSWIVTDGTTRHIVTDTFYTFSRLNPMTEYTFSVYTRCAGNDSMLSIASSITATTTCGTLTTLPYTMGFERQEGVYTGSESSTNFVECWHRLNNATMYFYPFVACCSYNHTPNGSQGLYWYNSTTQDSYGDYRIVVLPDVDTDIYPINTLQLSFWARSQYTYNYPIFTVGVMTDPNDINTFVAVDTIHVGNSTEWREYVTPLEAYTGNGAYVALRADRSSNYWYANVDDFTLEVIPDCPHVQNITVHSITTNSAELSWTETGSATNWEIRYLADGEPADNSMTLTVSDTHALLTGLQANTTYTVWITPLCSGSAKTYQTSFRTNCYSLDTLPYTMGFERQEGVYTGSESSTNFVECWHRLNNATMYFYPYVSQSNSYNHTPNGNRGLY
ncbi:MAG: fibronectin type III domain-containing protein, partial [Bacteroidales bacterium]|nr:fibronectin type III domain-containing protein [Bacteroidales bacterium]